MDIEKFREYCLSLKGVTEEFPFGPDTLVFKVMGKMFALTNLDGDFSVNLKCDPDRAEELREKYHPVITGFHMNKTHWNTILIDGTIPAKLIYEWISHSYTIVVDKLPIKLKSELEKL